MKPGTHNLGGNALSHRTIVRVKPGLVTIVQIGPGKTSEIPLSADQAALLKEVLS